MKKVSFLGLTFEVENFFVVPDFVVFFTLTSVELAAAAAFLSPEGRR